MAQQRFLTIDNLTHQTPPQWLVEGVFESGSLVMVAGPPASYKSFLALDWMLNMALGRRWNERKTIPSKVLYALGEGKSTLIKRIQAWLLHNHATEGELKALNDTFRVTFDVPQLAAKASVDNMLAQLEVEDFRPSVIVIDTFARAFVGLDENSQKDVGLWVEQADRLRQLGYTVIFLHHTAKNTDFGVKYRGSSAIMGAMDTAMTMVRNGSVNAGTVTVTITKQKDHDEGEPMNFKRLVVKDDPADDGSIVLVPIVPIDDSFTESYQLVDSQIKDLVNTPFESDRARARQLALMSGLSESAAQSRISRWKRENFRVVEPESRAVIRQSFEADTDFILDESFEEVEAI